MNEIMKKVGLLGCTLVWLAFFITGFIFMHHYLFAKNIANEIIWYFSFAVVLCLMILMLADGIINIYCAASHKTVKESKTKTINVLKKVFYWATIAVTLICECIASFPFVDEIIRYVCNFAPQDYIKISWIATIILWVIISIIEIVIALCLWNSTHNISNHSLLVILIGIAIVVALFIVFILIMMFITFFVIILTIVIIFSVIFGGAIFSSLCDR